jgi:transposase
MTNYTIGCDAHKNYSIFAVMNEAGQVVKHKRIDHHPGAIQAFLGRFPIGTPVALESIGNWYWIVEEIEIAGCLPLLTHPAKAKLMMGNVNKTDKLDAAGLATLLRLGSLPTVWIPPRKTRDERELPRTRMALVRMRTALKNRIQSTLAKYNRSISEASDVYLPKWRPDLEAAIAALPPETARCVLDELTILDRLIQQIKQMEKRIKATIQVTPSTQLLKTLPGVGDTLAIVIEREIGSIKRFSSAECFASYAGTVPTVHSSGGHTRYGHLRKQSNQYLKWAFIEAANTIVRHHRSPSWHDKHVVRLYRRIRSRKGHFIAVGALARHLSEAAFWVLTKNEVYREPARKKVSPKQG